jgi:hypothetical protein
MVDSPYLQNFLDFLLDIRNRIYDLIPDTPPTEPIVIETRDQDFQRPQTATPIGLGLLQTCRQVHAEFHSRIFARTFQFRNLDTLLALLARWPLARDHMRHVDLRLVSGPQGFDLHALLALSELPLDTLTIRCAEFQGRHVDWVRSLQMSYLLQTRGVRDVTFAPIHKMLDESLAIHDPLAKKLMVQLQRPATARSKLDPIALMPGYPAPGVSGCMPKPPHSWQRRSLADFRECEGDETQQHRMLDPLCKRHRGLMWCSCIGMASPWHFSSTKTDIFFQSAHKRPPRFLNFTSSTGASPVSTLYLRD